MCDACQESINYEDLPEGDFITDQEMEQARNKKRG